MIDKIELKPKIPETLRLASFQGKLIPFIGAGVSQLGGCPSWNEFANAAINFFVQKGKLNHAQLDQICTLSSRVKLSIALELQLKYNLPIDFEDLLKPKENTKKETGDKIYANLSKLATTFVTTNYDDWLDIKPSPIFRVDEKSSSSNPSDILRKSFYKRSDLSIENIDEPHAVFHIHGSICDRDSMVLTTIDYLDLYSSHRIDGKGNQENPYLTFLQDLFRLKNLLFIGYGLSELEILEYIVQKGIESPPNNEVPRHYVLQGFFTHEIELARSLENYYRQFGIGLLPFSRDERGWDQLGVIIEYLAREIPPGPPSALPKRLEMEKLLL